MKPFGSLKKKLGNLFKECADPITVEGRILAMSDNLSAGGRIITLSIPGHDETVKYFVSNDAAITKPYHLDCFRLYDDLMKIGGPWSSWNGVLEVDSLGQVKEFVVHQPS